MAQKIKTFEAACKKLAVDPDRVLPDVSGFPPQHDKALIAHAKLILIAQALNDGWIPDWNDHNQYKYYPWFEVLADKERPSGFGLAYYGYDYWDATTTVGSRLCFKTRELAEYAGKQYKDLFEEYYLYR